MTAEDIQDKLIMSATLDLSPQTVREHLMQLHFRQDSESKARELLGKMVTELSNARIKEYTCPFNPEMGGDGHTLIEEVRKAQSELALLKGIRKELDGVKSEMDSVQTEMDQAKGALSLLKWLGISNIAGIAALIIKAIVGA